MAYLAVEGDGSLTANGDPDMTNNGLFYIHSDHLGSTSVLTKYSDGYIRTDSLTRYTPFGRYRTGGPNPLTDRGYTGQRENMDLGLYYYYQARYYLPGVGRFISADTLVPDPTSPQSLNRYTYALNSPLVYIDPSGHCFTHYEEGSDALETCLITVDSAISFYTSIMRQNDQSLTEDQITTLRNNWQQTLTIENAQIIRDHFADNLSSLHHKTRATQPETQCRYWQDCYEPVFNGDYGVEIGTPVGAYEFNTGGNSINFSANTGGCPTGVGPCGFVGPESQINTTTRETVTGGNIFLGIGAGGEVSNIGMGIWAGSEFTSLSDQPGLIISYSNLIHVEAGGFSLELNYKPDVPPKEILTK